MRKQKINGMLDDLAGGPENFKVAICYLRGFSVRTQDSSRNKVCARSYLGCAPDAGCEFLPASTSSTIQEKSKIILFNEYDESDR